MKNHNAVPANPSSVGTCCECGHGSGCDCDCCRYPLPAVTGPQNRGA
jgi:hypothetical protein